MFLYRSLALGFLGACLLLLARGPNLEIRVAAPPNLAFAPRPALAPPVAAIVDVAAGIPAAQLGSLLRLGPGERVIAVDDREVANDLDAGALLASRDVRSGAYIDLTVRGYAGSRRLLVLMH